MGAWAPHCNAPCRWWQDVRRDGRAPQHASQSNSSGWLDEAALPPLQFVPANPASAPWMAAGKAVPQPDFLKVRAMPPCRPHCTLVAWHGQPHLPCRHHTASGVLSAPPQGQTLSMYDVALGADAKAIGLYGIYQPRWPGGDKAKFLAGVRAASPHGQQMANLVRAAWHQGPAEAADCTRIGRPRRHCPAVASCRPEAPHPSWRAQRACPPLLLQPRPCCQAAPLAPPCPSPSWACLLLSRSWRKVSPCANLSTTGICARTFRWRSSTRRGARCSPTATFTAGRASRCAAAPGLVLGCGMPWQRLDRRGHRRCATTQLLQLLS